MKAMTASKSLVTLRNQAAEHAESVNQSTDGSLLAAINAFRDVTQIL